MVNDVDGWEVENLVPCGCAVEISLLRHQEALEGVRGGVRRAAGWCDGVTGTSLPPSTSSKCKQAN